MWNSIKRKKCNLSVLVGKQKNRILEELMVEAEKGIQQSVPKNSRNY